MWERQRQLVCDAAGNRCEIYGGVGKRHKVEIHAYEYDEAARPPCQRIIGLIVLCPDCHAVKHLARTRLVARQTDDPSIYENALRHLATLNDWDAEHVKNHLAEVHAEFHRREALVGPELLDTPRHVSADRLSARLTSARARARRTRRIGHLGDRRVRSPAPHPRGRGT